MCCDRNLMDVKSQIIVTSPELKPVIRQKRHPGPTDVAITRICKCSIYRLIRHLKLCSCLCLFSWSNLHKYHKIILLSSSIIDDANSSMHPKTQYPIQFDYVRSYFILSADAIKPDCIALTYGEACP